MATDLAAVAKRLPPELRVRASGGADIERVVEFQNRWATLSHWMSPAAARAMMTASPEPLRVELLVRDGLPIAMTATMVLGTTNDEQNAAMRGINRRLGYVPDPPTAICEKRFS